jgi:transcriptional regulator with XRE-family HTH domain
VDVSFAIRRRLEELGLEQKDLARAARVTESYVSQLLRRKKAPPAPSRTDIYEKMDRLLKLPRGELARLAESQRKEQLKRELGGVAPPLFQDIRSLVLRKCRPEKEAEIRAIFERQPFGELERLVTQNLVDVVKRVAKAELENADWIHGVAKLAGRSYEETRVTVLEFLDADLFDLSKADCATFLDPLITSWDIDLTTFGLEVILDQRATPERVRTFAIVEGRPEEPTEEPGFRGFLEDRSLSGTATDDELEFLRKLRFKNRRPTPLYYYRELQSLRDPVHFRAV